MNDCIHVISRPDACSFCRQRGVAYCMLPFADPYYVDAQNCPLYENKGEGV